MSQESSPAVPTWRDFPEFYNNPFIEHIAGNPRWTVSDKDKRPIDMRAFIDQKKIWGLAWDRGYNPMVDLYTVCEAIPSARTNTYYLDAIEDGYVVMDIEPTCPDQLKTQFLSLPYVYGERSMSGHGLHLVFTLPADILEQYPIAKKKTALKHETGYYEILINHMVTFTRDTLPAIENRNSISSFENIFSLMASQAKETSSVKGEAIDPEISLDDIPYAESLVNALQYQNYKRKPEEFMSKSSGKKDLSAYEFGMGGFYFSRLERVMRDRVYKDHTYTTEECVRIVYELLRLKAPYRAKHDETRNGMPWLCFIAASVVAKNSDPDNPTRRNKKKGGT